MGCTAVTTRATPASSTKTSRLTQHTVAYPDAFGLLLPTERIQGIGPLACSDGF
jgi:hypothetical protein